MLVKNQKLQNISFRFIFSITFTAVRISLKIAFATCRFSVLFYFCNEDFEINKVVAVVVYCFNLNIWY